MVQLLCTRHRAFEHQGQAATELAVFGAIIIFLIGGIVRSSLSASYQQNQQLKSMRQALLMSYQGRAGGSSTTGHSSASILYIEDRITPDISKYGSPDRGPYVMSGSGTLTNMLMYPLDLPDVQNDANLSVMDVFINGQHFTFSTQGLEDRNITPPPATQCPGPSGGGAAHCGGWDFTCQGGVGCPLFYQMSINDGDYGILSRQEAYDLNRDDNFDNDPDTSASCDPAHPGTFTTGQLRPCYQSVDWHWKAVQGLCRNISIDTKNGNYPQYDAFNHKQEGAVYSVSCDGNGVITHALVLNNQAADMDTTRDAGSSRMQYGLQRDMSIYTRSTVGADHGAYLQLKEGKLYNPETGLLVRSVNKKDQVELIERRFLLSNNTGRMCDSSGTPTKNPIEACADTWQDCFHGDNIKLTCFGMNNSPDPDNPNARMLYIRTRLLDRRGLWWKTDVAGALP